MKHWLRDYEGERGVAYVIGIVSMFAPCILAVYWLEPQQFNTRNWPLTLLLAASIGGLINCICLAGCILESLLVETERFPLEAEKKAGLMVQALVLGPVTGLLLQLVAFGWASRYGHTFREFVSFAFAATFAFNFANLIRAKLDAWREKRKKVSDAVNGNGGP